VGIKLILNGKDIEINKAHNIDWRISNTLIAVPVKNKVKVTAGNFTATATMVLNVR
jgi:type 1 fimbria pilin